MTLSKQQRERFRQACAMVLPPWENMPGAGELGLENRLLDRVMATRPDLEEALTRTLAALPATLDKSGIAAFAERSPADFRSLVIVICGAYYLHPEVKKILGYHGQQALTLPKGGFGAEELVLKLLDQPKRFRDPDRTG